MTDRDDILLERIQKECYLVSTWRSVASSDAFSLPRSGRPGWLGLCYCSMALKLYQDWFNIHTFSSNCALDPSQQVTGALIVPLIGGFLYLTYRRFVISDKVRSTRMLKSSSDCNRNSSHFFQNCELAKWEFDRRSSCDDADIAFLLVKNKRSLPKPHDISYCFISRSRRLITVGAIDSIIVTRRVYRQRWRNDCRAYL